MTFANAFMYETLGTPGELPPADGRADGARPLNGYIVAGTSTWERNQPHWITRLLTCVFGGGWRS
jgi:hypothetical protein